MSEAFDPYYRWLGIPPAEQPPNAYRLLGLQLFEEDADVIEMAADQRMLHLRNFQTGEHSQASQTLLNELAAVRVLLLNPAKKASYDQGLREQWAAASTGQGGSKIRWEASVGIAVAAVLLLCVVVWLLSRRGDGGDSPQPQTASVQQERPPSTPSPASGSTTASPAATVEDTPPRRPSAPSDRGATAAGGRWPSATGGQTSRPAPKNAALSNVTEQVDPAAVRIEVGQKIGSGFIVDPTGIIVTNYHVIEGAMQASVVFSDDTTRPVMLAAVDKTQDIALLRIAATRRLPVMVLREDFPRMGERVVSTGAARDGSKTTSEGIIARVRTGMDLRQILGAEVFSALGYGIQTTWIQPTTPVSPENSGGPLADASGRVVGVNIWVAADTHNLSFALSSFDVARFLRTAGSKYRPLNVLAHQVPPPPSVSRHVSSRRRVPPPSVAEPDWRIELPSGDVLSASSLKVPRGWQKTMFPEKSSLYVTKYAAGAIQGIFSHDGGRLNGPSAELYESGQLCWLTSYYSSDRDGELRYWNSDKEWLLYAEYTRGRKDGVVCVFKDGKPWWLQHWEKDQLLNEYLVAWKDGTPTLTSGAGLEGEQAAKTFAAAHETLSDLEATIDKAETEAKQDLIDWYREEDQRIKQERAARVSVQKRQAILGRVQARGEAASAALQSQARTALSRSGW